VAAKAQHEPHCPWSLMAWTHPGHWLAEWKVAGTAVSSSGAGKGDSSFESMGPTMEPQSPKISSVESLDKGFS